MRIDPAKLTQVGQEYDSELINQIAGEVLANPMLIQTLSEMVLKLVKTDQRDPLRVTRRDRRDRSGMHRRLNG